MKKSVLLALLAAGLATAATAAVTAGIETGYLTDNHDAWLSGRVGWQFKAGASLSHQVELEVGYTEHAQIVSFGLAPDDDVTARSKLTPITINYRAETTRADKLGYYFGAGVGQTRVSASMPGSGVPVIARRETISTAQAFAGMNYRITPAATLDLGAKYIWIEETRMLLGGKVEIDADLALTAGVSFKF